MRGVSAKSQVTFPVCYKGQYGGDYVADLVVEEKLIVELKWVDRFANEHLAQCINYLKASRLRVALLINFQRPKVEWKRVLLVLIELMLALVGHYPGHYPADGSSNS